MSKYGYKEQENFYNHMNNVKHEDVKKSVENEKNKDELIKLIEHLNPNQTRIFLNLVKVIHRSRLSKGDLMNIVWPDGHINVDSATPHTRYKAISEVYPEFDTTYIVYSYRQEDGGYGSYVNLAERLIEQLQKLD